MSPGIPRRRWHPHSQHPTDTPSTPPPEDAKKPRRRFKRNLRCSRTTGLYICGHKCCPGCFIAWLPLCVLLILFIALFLGGLALSFFLTNSTFALLDQEDTFLIDPWKPNLTGTWYLALVNDKELGESFYVNVRFPLVTYVPSLIPISVAHYGLSVKYTPLSGGVGDAKVLTSMCVLNNVRKGGVGMCGGARRLGAVSHGLLNDSSSPRLLEDTVDLLTQPLKEWLPNKNLMIEEHMELLTHSYTTWMSALEPTSRAMSNPSFGFLPRLRHQVVANRNATRSLLRQNFIWPLQSAPVGDATTTNKPNIEVSWEVPGRKHERRQYVSHEKGSVYHRRLSDAPTHPSAHAATPPPGVLDVIKHWSFKENTTEDTPHENKGLASEHYVPKWRQNQMNRVASLKNQPTRVSTKAPVTHTAVEAYRKERWSVPRDIRVSVQHNVSRYDVSWWLTSVMLTRLETCFEEARRMVDLVQTVGERDLPADLRVSSNCGEQWAMGASMKKEMKEERRRRLGADTGDEVGSNARSDTTLIDKALLASALADVSVDYVFPPEYLEYEDPLRNRRLPKGQETIGNMSFLARIPTAANPEMYQSIIKDCTTFGILIAEVRFEDAYPCDWCSLFFKPQTYRYPFVMLCWTSIFDEIIEP
eukprot:Blabericola_migrator_1__3732@NODE_2118_length_3244_cov_47_326723_g1343_i0_p1_GENE_NODE_2118_length_3244_cov_47_326723_g1343_i0NODE_2118_length_3244_cov_47_326723_g1343_i0_p1_ORF_typecomplete_len644_score105_41_NODE_2118_length_3244_cov_47_326723_g1343_i012603191